MRSPAVAVAGETEIRVAGLPGSPSLAARLHATPGAVRAVAICHPHPLYGGSMNSPVPLAIARCLSDQARERVAWARFDFRGVGASDGVYDDARGEVDDALAVIDELRRAVPGVPIAVCGHSFGSWVGLRAAARSPSVDRVLLIAPSVRFGASDGPASSARLQKTIFIGDRDEFCDVDEARVLADDLGADLRVFEGFDHHFLKSRRALAEAALPIIAPEVVS